MGIEIEVDSLEDLCDLMCYNKIPKKKRKGRNIMADEITWEQVQECCHRRCLHLVSSDIFYRWDEWNKWRQRDKLTPKHLQEIREYIVNNVMREPEIMFSDDRLYRADLPEIIASLYELLHREVTGEPYQYFHHFANEIGSDVEDDLFTKE